MPSLIQKYLLSKHFLLLLFLLIFLIRFIHLDADPSFVKRVSDIADEAGWGLDPRNAILFGDWFIGDLHVGLDMAPLYTYLLYISFKLFGPGLFALRVLPAFSGFLTAVLLYFLVRKLADQKQALLALCIFGFGNVVVVYNRLGHLESILALFLLVVFTWWQFGRERKLFYLASGMFYGLAILIKFSALIFFPALMIYWYFELVKSSFEKNNEEKGKPFLWRQSLKETFFIRKVVCFSLGTMIPLLFYLYLFLVPYWENISKSLFAHGKNNFFGVTFALNAFKVIGNNLFGLPTFTILFFLFLIYLFWKLSLLEKLSLNALVRNSTPLELMALSWVIGGLLGILVSDVSDRRFTIMFVPLIILVAHLLANFKDFSLQELVTKIISPGFRHGFFNTLTFYFLLFLPAFSLPYLFLRLIAKDTILFNYGSIFIFALFVAVSLLFCLLEKKIAKKELLARFLLMQFSFFVLFDPLTTLVRHFTRHFSIVFSVMEFEETILMAITAFSFFTLLLACFFFFRKGACIKKKHLFLILVVYFLVSATLIGNVLLAPGFTIVEGSKELAGVAEPGAFIFGTAAEELLYGTKLKYLFYEPYHDKFYSLNKDLWDYDPKYFAYFKEFDGKPIFLVHQKTFEDVKLRYDLKKVKEINLYRYPLTNKYKVKIEIFELNERDLPPGKERADPFSSIKFSQIKEKAIN